MNRTRISLPYPLPYSKSRVSKLINTAVDTRLCGTENRWRVITRRTAASHYPQRGGIAGCSRMENGEHGQSESKDKIIPIYSDFMTRITQFEELVSTGSRLLCGFQQALGFLGRPSIDKASTLVDRIIKAHGSRRVLSYVEAGCINSHDSSQNVSKLHTCHLGLLDYINKGKIIIDELECLLDDAASVVQIANKNDDDDAKGSSDSVVSLSREEEVPSSDLSKPEDFATAMAIIYSMVKRDYTMQVQIVSSLNQKSSPGELETYCHMWSLRPFVDDDVMHRAWRLVRKP